ncbi:MAG TPA: hypothetical protein DD490_03790 [Acidobacteria bacterium]|nr:hypothetical protein [Acidobacteriota bacterium]
MALPTIEILKKAEHLAARLNSGPAPVKKNVLLGLVSDFMNEPEPDIRRLRTLLEMIEQGSGGHIRRGAGYGDQLRAAVREIRRVLDEGGIEGRDFKSLFGWTARLLLVRSAPREAQTARPPDEGRRPGRPLAGRPAAGRHEPPPPRPATPQRLGSVGSQGMSTLEKLKRDLADKEGVSEARRAESSPPDPLSHLPSPKAPGEGAPPPKKSGKSG